MAPSDGVKLNAFPTCSSLHFSYFLLKLFYQDFESVQHVLENVKFYLEKTEANTSVLEESTIRVHAYY